MNEADFNEHRTPNLGWRWYQPETKWHAPTPIASTLNQTCILIQKMRIKNPAITQKFKLSLDLTVIKSEVVRYNRKLNGLPEELTPLPFSTPHRYPSGSSAGAVGGRTTIGSMEGLKRAAQGTAVILDWLMAGGAPVEQELANKRAAVCIGCKKNVEGAWFTEAPAALIKKTLEARKDLKLETPHDASLKSCEVCKCINRLKVWCPMEHILSKTRPEIFAEFPPWCWVKKKDSI